MTQLITNIQSLINDSSKGEKFPLAKLISLIENKYSLRNRQIIFKELEANLKPNCLTIGFTGTPGAGKSSLIGELCNEFLDRFPDKRMAVVAIDPSSSISGGSILGDRTRINIPARENRIYFRSQASQLEMGGVNPFTYHVIRLLRYFFDYIIIETVGIGQNEIEVSKLVDHSFLILQPLAGDNIQFMKSGIMEVPDAFIINKCDEKALALSSYHMLENSLEFLKDILKKETLPKIFQTSVLKRIGIIELFDYLFNLSPQISAQEETERQITKWIKNEYGSWGLRKFTEFQKINSQNNSSFEEIEVKFSEYFQGNL